jgi:hypothetical protein
VGGGRRGRGAPPDGSLDPADEAVRQECARHATTLRRALADRARLGRELLAGLEPALSMARGRGLQVEIQVVGDPGLPSRDITQATIGAVDTVLRALPPQTVTLTVLAGDVLADSAASVELYLTFGYLPPAARTPPPAGIARWRAGLDVDAAGAGCLEVSWGAAVPA